MFKFQAIFGLSFDPRLDVGVFSEPVGFVFEIVVN